MVGGEVNERASVPWDEATRALFQLVNADANQGRRSGTSWDLANSSDLGLVIWRPDPKTHYPEPQSVKADFYVVGLTGTINGEGSGRVKWEIRYDWDATKKYHVNLHVTITTTTHYSFNDEDTPGERESFQLFLRSARSATLTSHCYDGTSWAANSEDAWLTRNELTPVAHADADAKRQYAQTLWETLFNEGRCFEDSWKRVTERQPAAAIESSFAPVIRFDRRRTPSVTPEIREFWVMRAQQYLRDRQEWYALALIA